MHSVVGMRRADLPLLLLLAHGVAASAPLPELTHRERLADLFHSISTTHGGPAYISRAELKRLHRETEQRCAGADGDEEAYLSACRWAMQQLSDPLACYLPPAQAGAVRERFHGAATLGLKLEMRLRRARAPGDAPAQERESPPAPAPAPAAGFRAWAGWWPWARPRGWERAPTVVGVDEGSPASCAGVRVGDELLAVTTPGRTQCPPTPCAWAQCTVPILCTACGTGRPALDARRLAAAGRGGARRARGRRRHGAKPP